MPTTDEQRQHLKEADEHRARNHIPTIARTLKGGPGNQSRIVGCGCRSSAVSDATTWAEHVGTRNILNVVETALAVSDAWRDVIDYPGPETMSTLEYVLELRDD